MAAPDLGPPSLGNRTCARLGPAKSWKEKTPVPNLGPQVSETERACARLGPAKSRKVGVLLFLLREHSHFCQSHNGLSGTEGDFLATFRAQIAARSPDWTLQEWPWPQSFGKEGATTNPTQLRLDLNAINEQQQESQFKADMLSLNADLCKYCLHVQEQQSNSKAQKIALAAWVRNQVHSARTQVIEPFMQNMRNIKGCETGASQVQAWSRFLRCGPDSSTNGVVLKIFYCDCNKFGRMSDDAVSNMFDVVQQAAAQDPTNFAAIIVPTTVVSKKRLTGAASSTLLAAFT